MHLAGNLLIGIIAALHAWSLILETFLWTKPLGLKPFGRTQAERHLRSSARC